MKKRSRKAHFLMSALIAALLTCSAAMPALAAPQASVSLNSAPVAENMELDTYRRVPVSGTFRCVDPEGDSVTYAVVKDPVKGAVTVEGDTFVYTPGDGKKGRDSFTYIATDTAGNVSNAATVTVNIKKQRTEVTYSDLTDSPVAYAAAVMAERGIFVGECVGGSYLFRPEETVTRGEFLVMCMKLTGAPLLEDVTRTGFYDDGEIPLWQKPYITTALMDDVIHGSANADGHIVFDPSSPVTYAEAWVMLSNCLEITDVAARETSAPAWAAQAEANLSSCGIIPAASGVSALTLTRADAAKLLLGGAELLDRRGGDTLLGWAK